MEPEISVAKGVFIYKNGFKPAKRRSKQVRKKHVGTNLLSDSLWHTTYNELWNFVETKLEALNDEMFSWILGNLISFVKDSYANIVDEIPTAVLLTGINMPDHGAQFTSLARKIRREITPHVAQLHAEDCQSLKYLVENLIDQIINRTDPDISDDNEDSSEEDKRRIKKAQCNFALIQAWYEDLYPVDNSNGFAKKRKVNNGRKPLVIILPEFESFSDKVIQEFILILSSYINVLPFILIFGVATSLTALHRSLPYHVSSKLKMQGFQSQPSTAYLNSVLEKVFFTGDFPFHLGGTVFNLFLDQFLFYDLSTIGFIKNCKYAMIEHFSQGDHMALCTLNDPRKAMKNFSHNDWERVRHFMSFRRLVESESYENRIKLLTDDCYLEGVVLKELGQLRAYVTTLHLFVKCLLLLVHDLPRAPLGKQLREIYSATVSSDIVSSPEFKECFQLLTFQSKDELCLKLSNIINLIKSHINNNHDVCNVGTLEKFLEILEVFSGNINDITKQNVEESCEMIEVEDMIVGKLDRLQLKQKLIDLSKQTKSLNKYEKIRLEVLEFLQEGFKNYLIKPTNFYFHEIFFFNDSSIQHHITGTHRAAIHMALNDPHHYLQCSCCKLRDNSLILPCMPDICIAYKLHLECGKMINLYDWLQAFLTIVDRKHCEDNSKRIVDPELQARFTQAVAELEYLGFIKSSKRKTDHVSRLTWGG